MDSPKTDEILWKIAIRRANFKKHLYIYIVIQLFLWSIWGFSWYSNENWIYPWPLWPALGWGLGIFFHYIYAYNNTSELAKKEYEKLKEN